ncbi:hypothetical protein THAOC_24030, partial [Thalassiosira oceanica]
MTLCQAHEPVCRIETPRQNVISSANLRELSVPGPGTSVLRYDRRAKQPWPTVRRPPPSPTYSSSSPGRRPSSTGSTASTGVPYWIPGPMAASRPGPRRPSPATTADPTTRSDGDSDSSDDDGGGMLMIGGGYSSSDDDEACDGDGGGDCDGEPTRIQSDPNPDEDESALLRRASTLHAGLLISIECGSGADGIVAGVVSGGGGRVASLLRSVLTAPPGAGPRSVTRELWNKVRLTNALLAVQYLLHLRSTSTVVGEGGAANGGGLDGWNAVTLPLLFL